MNVTKTALAALIVATLPLTATAQTSGNDGSSANMYERNVYQQQRIEQGLRDGSLTVQEAAALQRGESHISRMEARALADGNLSNAERARINEAQNRQSTAINRERSDADRGDPNSRSAQRMQQDVQRNVNEQRRIAQGVASGQITEREAARLQRGEAFILHQEARAGADGRIDRREQRRIQGAENQQSREIYRQSHDAQSNRPTARASESGSGRSWQSRSEDGSRANRTQNNEGTRFHQARNNADSGNRAGSGFQHARHGGRTRD